MLILNGFKTVETLLERCPATRCAQVLLPADIFVYIFVYFVIFVVQNDECDKL